MGNSKEKTKKSNHRHKKSKKHTHKKYHCKCKHRSKIETIKIIINNELTPYNLKKVDDTNTHKIKYNKYRYSHSNTESESSKQHNKYWENYE
jgi:hypothetical protein